MVPRGASPAAAPFFPNVSCGAAGASEGYAPRGVSTVGRISIGSKGVSGVKVSAYRVKGLAHLKI